MKEAVAVGMKSLETAVVQQRAEESRSPRGARRARCVCRTWGSMFGRLGSEASGHERRLKVVLGSRVWSH